MNAIVPCLWFDTQAEEAATYYISVFGGDSGITDVAYYGKENPDREGQVITVEFTLRGHPYIALNGGPQFTFTEAVSFQVFCADQDEVDHFWDTLTSDGGEEGPCGWLKDKYGLSWQIIPTRFIELTKDPDPERILRATTAMLGMKKLDIAELERAADA